MTKLAGALMRFAVTIFFRIYFAIFGKPKLDKPLIEAVGLYSDSDFGELFSHIRSWDAPYSPVNRAIPKKARVVDLGSGDGLLANYLAISSGSRKVTGIEISGKRHRESKKGVKNANFIKADILKARLPAADVYILAHVLHHLPSRGDQLTILEKLSVKMKKGQKLIILEIDKKPFWKYIFSVLTDAITFPILFESKLFSLAFFYRSKKEWEKLLLNLEFRVEAKNMDCGMPFSHVLIIAKKK